MLCSNMLAGFASASMQTDSISDLFGFVALEGRPVAAAFDGGSITSDPGALLLGATDRAIGLIHRFAACFRDYRCPGLISRQALWPMAQASQLLPTPVSPVIRRFSA